jgi:DNA ligase-1
MIHCTQVTANLLVNVHQVPSHLVMPHPYGSTFEYALPNSENNETAKITFYDAHHCPGACIILIELPDGHVHVHTGDMRYKESLFQSYPRLNAAVKENKIDTVYLDTTYSHPKHDFCPQEEAVNEIARQTQQLLANNTKYSPEPGSSDDHMYGNTLVLLSCYSIGKEKVLREAGKRCQQPVYVSEKKWKMLQCIADDATKEDRYTTGDPTNSDIHVIPMGLAGEMWPFFRPNFQKVATYVQELESSVQERQSVSTRPYKKVVAFIPTGWANASNWNKKNSVSIKQVSINTPHGGPPRNLHVEIRLVGYSEHSSFSELVSFVRFLKPRRVIPTVFSDDADRRKIVERFRNYLDPVKAKRAFFRTMIAKEFNAKSDHTSKKNAKAIIAALPSHDSALEVSPQSASVQSSKIETKVGHCMDNDSDCEVIGVRISTVSSSAHKESNEAVDTLVAMGFQRQQAKESLGQCEHDVQMAIEMLLQSSRDQENSSIPTKSNEVGPSTHSKPAALILTNSPDKKRKRSNGGGKGTQITDFFRIRR